MCAHQPRDPAHCDEFHFVDELCGNAGARRPGVPIEGWTALRLRCRQLAVHRAWQDPRLRGRCVDHRRQVRRLLAATVQGASRGLARVLRHFGVAFQHHARREGSVCGLRQDRGAEPGQRLLPRCGLVHRARLVARLLGALRCEYGRCDRRILGLGADHWLLVGRGLRVDGPRIGGADSKLHRHRPLRRAADRDGHAAHGYVAACGR
mmetsp:Transcript_8289/g.20936  ORF Transcript_8289/g.20936 Transcript_8289/m.20936 type:complete len:207 (+) Transcript_8289:548-1168(+)